MHRSCCREHWTAKSWLTVSTITFQLTINVNEISQLFCLCGTEKVWPVFTFSLFQFHFQASESCFAALISSVIPPKWGADAGQNRTETLKLPPSYTPVYLQICSERCAITGEVSSGRNGRYLHPMPGRQCSSCAIMVGQYREWPQSRVSHGLSVCGISLKSYLHPKCTICHIFINEESVNGAFWVPVLALHLDPELTNDD